MHFQVRPPCEKITKYSMHVGDERIIATLAVFWPTMFGLKGKITPIATIPSAAEVLLSGCYR